MRSFLRTWTLDGWEFRIIMRCGVVIHCHWSLLSPLAHSRKLTAVERVPPVTTKSSLAHSSARTAPAYIFKPSGRTPIHNLPIILTQGVYGIFSAGQLNSCTTQSINHRRPREPSARSSTVVRSLIERLSEVITRPRRSVSGWKVLAVVAPNHGY